MTRSYRVTSDQERWPDYEAALDTVMARHEGALKVLLVYDESRR